MDNRKRGLEFTYSLKLSDRQPDEVLSAVAKAVAQCATLNIVTPNVDHIARIYDSEELASIYRNADLSILDSAVFGMVLRALIGEAVPVYPGSELTRDLLDIANKFSWRCLVIGGSDDTIPELRRKYNNIEFQQIIPSIGFISKPTEISALIEEVSQKSTDLLFAAVGSPQQEILVAELINKGCRWGAALSCGASIDFLTGQQKEPPRFLRLSGFEWFYRMLSEPTRLAPRYLSNMLWLAKFCYHCVRR